MGLVAINELDFSGEMWYTHEMMEVSMTKRSVDLDQLRSIVRARMTKGAAFMLSDKTGEYQAKQAEVKAMLEGMSREQIMAKWPDYTYDIKPR